MYIVVYEYTQESGGKFGLREIVEFETEQESWCADTFGLSHPIAQGITIIEALNLVCLTPEIARVTAVIEASSLENGEIVAEDLKQRLHNA